MHHCRYEPQELDGRSQLAARDAEVRRLRDLWQRYLSAQKTIENSGFMDNYTDAARARDDQARVILEARSALAADGGSDG